MLTLFLLGLLAAISMIVTIFVIEISGKWLKEYVAKKLKNREKHKVALADMREIIADEDLRNKAKKSDEIPMEELEKMCEKYPYVAAVVDEDGEISEYEGFKANDYNENFVARIKQEKGMIIVGA